MKKAWIVFFAILPLIFITARLDVKEIFQKSGQGCAFCDSQLLYQQAVLAEDSVLGIFPHKPVVSGHLLICPGRHVERFEELTPEEMENIRATISRVHTASQVLFHNTGYLLLQKNGREAGQSVPHLHFHYIPCSLEKSKLLFTCRLFITPWLRPVSTEERKFQVGLWRGELETMGYFREGLFSSQEIYKISRMDH